MVKLSVQIKADVENLTDLKPSEDCEYYFKIKCTSCNEVAQKWMSFNRQDTYETTSRGSAHFVFKCKFCSREGSIEVEKGPLGSYTLDDARTFKTVVVLDCRGLEPVDFEPRAGWTARSSESKSSWDEIDLSEKDWTEYDEKAGLPVSITDLETRIQRA